MSSVRSSFLTRMSLLLLILLLILPFATSFQPTIGDRLYLGRGGRPAEISSLQQQHRRLCRQQEERRAAAAAASSSSFLLKAVQDETTTTTNEVTTAAQSSSLSLSDAGDVAAQAGADGYSVLRQPISKTNWDPEEAPHDYSLPLRLRQQQQDGDGGSGGNARAMIDSEWWTSHNGRRRVVETTKQRQYAATKEEEEEEDEAEDKLDLFQRSLDTLDYPRILKALYKECSTAPARRLVQEAAQLDQVKAKRGLKGKERAFQPLTADTVEGAQERYRAVQELGMLMDGGDDDEALDDVYFRNYKGYKEELAGRPPPLYSAASAAAGDFDLDMILQAVDQGRVLESEEILLVADMINTMETVQSWGVALNRVKQESNETVFLELPKLAVDCIHLNTTLQDLLQSAFQEEKGTKGSNRRILSGSTFPVVGQLRARVRVLRGEIMATLEGLVSTPSMKSKLALESGGPLYSEVNGGRLVFPVAAEYASAIGIVHDTSRSGKTVYVEPTEIVGPTNELRQVESELRAEEARVWRLLTLQIVHNRKSLETSVAALGQLDLVVARYRLGQKWQGVIPVVQDEGAISLRNAQHPVLLLRKSVQNVVGSDVELGANGNQGLVLTGPNSGGKTIILKLLGLLALMARGGIPVPADRAENVKDLGFETEEEEQEAAELLYQPRVDFFNPVLADIGDIQSVGGDLSTFSGHMLVCREVLSNAGRNALVLMDEVGSGTDPNQGVAIAQALLEALLEAGARVAITTHFLQLKQLAASDPRFAVAGMQFVNGKPTYKLLPGTIGESFALAVAERLELPRSVLSRATELLDSETRQMGDLIRELEDQKALVDQQAAAMEERKREMARLEQKLKEEQIRLEKKQLVARREEAKKFAQKLEEKEQVLEDILDKLKADPSRRLVAKSWQDIKFVKRDAINEAENVPSVLARKQRAAAAIDQQQAELVPIAEMRDAPDLNPGDTVVVCKKGPLFGREAAIVGVAGRRIDVKVNNMNVALKLDQVALPSKRTTNAGPSNKSTAVQRRKSKISKAAERALANEREDAPRQQPSNNDKKTDLGLTIRTQSNTVDVRGCNLEQAKELAKAKFSACLMTGRSTVVYILHGHGTGGVLKAKLRNWLKSEQSSGLVKKYRAADPSDGGDAFTRVELR